PAKHGENFSNVSVLARRCESQTRAPFDLECGDMSPLSDWQTCLPVPKRPGVAAWRDLRTPK
ncbi:MAG TPA: hypothetical protein VN761_08120, partial [Candidatus Polarisedimenticolia bacterium]|nr:hypothetical protein [Candidatus Polarisedimenticolia bacterium]